MKKKVMPETTMYKKIGKVGLIEYKGLNEFKWLMNAFSTREGGVSEGQFATMNFSVAMGDDPGKVAENFRIFGNAIGVNPEDMVYADQRHTDHVVVVGAEHKGMGVTRERDFTHVIGYAGVSHHSKIDSKTENVRTSLNRQGSGFDIGVDGLVTNEPGVCLVTSYADCVPLYFVDPVHRAIGLTHSGWRGTVAKIGTRTIELMHEKYGSEPKDMVCAIGPCIGKECYEVSEDVAKAFEAAYTKEQYERICEAKEQQGCAHSFTDDEEKRPENCVCRNEKNAADADNDALQGSLRETCGKYLLDLPQANYEQFVEIGVMPENIHKPDLCTACNHELLHSHRATGGKRGGNCAFLMIK